jgi:SUMO ligase MMS21 Smc5/6 complex component
MALSKRAVAAAATPTRIMSHLEVHLDRGAAACAFVLLLHRRLAAAGLLLVVLLL